MARHGQHRDSEEHGRRGEQGWRGESERHEGGQQGWTGAQYDRNRESRSGRESGQSGRQEGGGFEERGRYGTGPGDYESMEDFSSRHGGPRGRGQASGSGWGPEQEPGQGSYRGNSRSWEGEERGPYMDRQRDYRQGEFGGDPYRERGFGGASEQGRHGQGGGWSEQGRHGQGGMGQGWGPSGREQGWGEGEFGGFGRGSGMYEPGGEYGGRYGRGGMGQSGGRQYPGGESYGGGRPRGYGQRGFGGYAEMGRGQFTGRGPKGYRRSDDRIKEDVCEQLTLHPDIDASEVEIKVQAGEVTLTGTVDDRQTKRMIEDVAESASGVKEVNNQLRVKQREGTGGVSNGAGTGETPGSRSRT